MRRRFYAFRVLPNGKRQRLTPMGQRVFGTVLLAWQKRRAKKFGWTIIVKRAKPLPDDARRDEAQDSMRWALVREPNIHYSQQRPFKVNAVRDRHASIYTDCSGMATLIDRAAGFGDPNGEDYSGQGWTGTVRARCPRKSLGDLLPGDKIVYGRGDGVHMVTVFSGGQTNNPVVFSHGQESGPRLYTHSVQVSVHGSTFTCHGVRS